MSCKGFGGSNYNRAAGQTFEYLVEYEDDNGDIFVEVLAPATFKVPPNTIDVGETVAIKDGFSLIGIEDKVAETFYDLPYVFRVNEQGTSGGVFYRKISQFDWTNPFGGGFVPSDDLTATIDPETGLYFVEQLVEVNLDIAIDQVRYWCSEYNGNTTNGDLTGDMGVTVWTTDGLGGSNKIKITEIGNPEDLFNGVPTGFQLEINEPENVDVVVPNEYVLTGQIFQRVRWYSKLPFKMKRMSPDGGITNLVYVDTLVAPVEFKRIITEDDLIKPVINITFYSDRRVTNDRGLEVYNGNQSWQTGGIDDGALPYLNEANATAVKAAVTARSLAISNNAIPDPIVNLNFELYEVDFTSTTKIADIIVPVDSTQFTIGGNSSTNNDTFFRGFVDLNIPILGMKSYGIKFVSITGTGNISAYRDVQLTLKTEQDIIVTPVVIF